MRSSYAATWAVLALILGPQIALAADAAAYSKEWLDEKTWPKLQLWKPGRSWSARM